MPDPTQHSLPEVPDALVHAIVSDLNHGPSIRTGGQTSYPPVTAAEVKAALEKRLPSLHAAWEKERAEGEFQIIRCKVCGEQMQEGDHGYLSCACKGWGDEVESDNDRGIFDDARHELLAVVPASAPNVLSKEEARLAADPPNRVGEPDRFAEYQRVVARLSDWAEERTGE